MSTINTDITHPLLQIIPCTKDLFHIYLNVGIDFSDDLFDKIQTLFKDGLGTKQKPLKCNTLQINVVKNLIQMMMKLMMIVMMKKKQFNKF